MQIRIPANVLAAPDIAEAAAILRSCVHCGFCTATCPTYQLLGNELDSPRGRIYLIKEMLEGKPVTDATRAHLDRCLSCRSCETTCPSGVQYGHLLDIGRQEIERRAPRAYPARLARRALLHMLARPQWISWLLRAGRMARPVLPDTLRRKIPARQPAVARLAARHERRMLALEGCVQPVAAPNTNAVAAQVLDRLGISLIAVPQAGCCGALHQHLGESEAAKQYMRRNIDAWWPLIEQGAEAIVITASGCGTTVKDYGRVLRDDVRYASKAERVSALARDLSEILHDTDLSAFADIGQRRRVAYQAPCSLQHGQKISGAVEDILRRCGYELVSVADGHLCCGAAGTYTLLQPELSAQLLENKLAALQREQPRFIVSANVGCQMHLASAADVPVTHWGELLIVEK
jgi:glycolate oxidase iron-sulfur subunit